jgi:hypothetical protein
MGGVDATSSLGRTALVTPQPRQPDSGPHGSIRAGGGSFGDLPSSGLAQAEVANGTETHRRQTCISVRMPYSSHMQTTLVTCRL